MRSAPALIKSRDAGLHAIFYPRSIAVVGATEKSGSVGRTVLDNLHKNDFGGPLYPINPKRTEILGLRAYPSIRTLPEVPDLAVIVTPAATVSSITRECAELGVRGAVVISAGFKECGSEGREREREILESIRGSSMRIVGPNCLGVMNSASNVNATFAQSMIQRGSVGFISQSGALCTAILDWSFRESVGFSIFASTGSMLDVSWGDLINYLGDDPNTRSIVIYMESIGNARAFADAARQVAERKPIIVIKAGRSEAAAKAAASHTGALTGSDAVLDAAFRRCGVLRVNSIAEVFYTADVLSKQPSPRGPRLTIVTNAGGPGVLATDALVFEGGSLAELSVDSIERLNSFLPPHWSHGNPIDVLGDADADRYAHAVEIVARDANSDGLLVVLTPQAMTDPTRTAEKIAPLARATGKPILASWMGAGAVIEARRVLAASGIPVFPYPDTAARMFEYMWQHSVALRRLREESRPEEFSEIPGRTQVEELLKAIRMSGRTLLTESESKRVLACYGMPIVPTQIAPTAADAARIASDLGFPVVVKLLSNTITHKTDVGGVLLNLCDESTVRQAFESIRTSVTRHAGAEHFQGVTVQPMIRRDGYELILGGSTDSQFGPVVLFGSGGQLVEVYRDRTIDLPPLNRVLAREMIERTRIHKALLGIRGRKPVSLEAIEHVMVRFSELLVEQRWIAEAEINPLVVAPDTVLALDARIVLHPLSTQPRDIPRAALYNSPNAYMYPDEAHR